MTYPNFILKYYAFNVYNRDAWILEQSKLIPKGSFVLDVGAGSAPYRNFFKHCIYKTHDFIQLKDHLLRGYQGYHHIDYVSDICNIPIKDCFIDYIICTEVIEHVPEPIKAIKEMYRLLNSKGVLILTAPLGSGLHQEPFHFYGGYTPHFYNKFLNEIGFSKIEIIPNMGFYSHLSQELIRYIRKMAPWKSILNFILLPIWLLILFCSFLLPLLSPILDANDKQNGFAVGYHVKATK